MFARTQRLVLRPGWTEDAEALATALGDHAVRRNLLRVPEPYGVQDARDFLRQPQDPLLPNFLAFARTGGAPRLVGGCGLTRDEQGRPELGYWIARPFWGLGFATEAVQAVMAIARSAGIGTVRASAIVDNRASAKVLHKAGFRDTGRIQPRYSAGRGEDVPCALFEDDAHIPMRDDPALELYLDRAPIAA
ncbi:GNAT family N-acetyltransferase [Sphingobium subterraneum]|uniref:RimJ/RimL family protein N-acetyltransferase n=1 Tax=Sphingobium subterraneum TaxID=627688 RepID=A0A841J431_9SPHN|nr:GNAT family N-acetyltransferase [Sphingobium subterraneum]MBB6124276.1 RimJ/RimL family protein N-acetyltransferase [Sphingobium subterraneum]